MHSPATIYSQSVYVDSGASTNSTNPFNPYHLPYPNNTQGNKSKWPFFRKHSKYPSHTASFCITRSIRCTQYKSSHALYPKYFFPSPIFRRARLTRPIRRIMSSCFLSSSRYQMSLYNASPPLLLSNYSSLYQNYLRYVYTATLLSIF
jgi:hypothetical protein